MTRKRLILLGCILVGVLMLALPLSNLFIKMTPTPEFLAIHATSPAMERAKAAIGQKCLMCHAQNPNNMYFPCTIYKY